ncbi:MAG: aldo/keto reductase [Defluviitaleaceae bacterium]|nr:aldo/keto reductase [Defluviitaleaceae bacterium]
MQKRIDKIFGNKLPALGFGCMRFPLLGGEAERMVIAALDGGINFFDTAYLYPNNEKILGNILKKHAKRSEIYISTKLPIAMCKKYEDFDRFFNEQLKRLQTDYIDYYFMHNITSLRQWKALLALGIEKWLAEKKAAGQIKRVGFSYHGSGEEFPRVLDSSPWEFCMIQYNYYDENYQAGKAGLRAAAQRGLPVFIMEPLLGGKLATGLPQKAMEIFKNASPNKTPANWALDWLWQHDEVTMVLSGMTDVEKVQENIKAASDFKPLTADELAVFAQIREEFKKVYKLNCTGCNYCLPCPKGINIPARFSAYNASYARGYFTGITMYFTGMGIMSQEPVSLHSCSGCGKCEKSCPQHIEIPKELKHVAKRFESLPFRVVMWFIRRFWQRETS